jgi:hypothetical protein
VSEKQIKVEELFPPLAGNIYREREREYVVDNFLTSKEQARVIAKTEGGFLYGRYKGIQCCIGLRDELFSASPLFRLDWIELSGIQQAYLVDGLSVALTTTRFAVSFDGVWIGVAVPSGVVPPYQTIQRIDGGEGSGGSIKVFSYALSDQLVAISGGDGSGGKVDVSSDILIFSLVAGTGDGGSISLVSGRYFTLDSGENFVLDNDQFLDLD